MRGTRTTPEMGEGGGAVSCRALPQRVILNVGFTISIGQFASIKPVNENSKKHFRRIFKENCWYGRFFSEQGKSGRNDASRVPPPPERGHVGWCTPKAERSGWRKKPSSILFLTWCMGATSVTESTWQRSAPAASSTLTNGVSFLVLHCSTATAKILLGTPSPPSST